MYTTNLHELCTDCQYSTNDLRIHLACFSCNSRRAAVASKSVSILNHLSREETHVDLPYQTTRQYGSPFGHVTVPIKHVLSRHGFCCTLFALYWDVNGLSCGHSTLLRHAFNHSLYILRVSPQSLPILNTPSSGFISFSFHREFCCCTRVIVYGRHSLPIVVLILISLRSMCHNNTNLLHHLLHRPFRPPNDSTSTSLGVQCKLK